MMGSPYMQSGNDTKAPKYWELLVSGILATMGNILSVKPLDTDTVCITSLGFYPSTVPLKGVKMLGATQSWSARWVGDTYKLSQPTTCLF